MYIAITKEEKSNMENRIIKKASVNQHTKSISLSSLLLFLLLFHHCCHLAAASFTSFFCSQSRNSLSYIVLKTCLCKIQVICINTISAPFNHHYNQFFISKHLGSVARVCVNPHIKLRTMNKSLTLHGVFLMLSCDHLFHHRSQQDIIHLVVPSLSDCHCSSLYECCSYSKSFNHQEVPNQLSTL